MRLFPLNGRSEASFGRGRRRSFVPGVEMAESRVVLSTVGALPHLSIVHQASTVSASASLNQKIVDFLASKVGQRIGDGECAQVATEALRVSGGKFVTGSNSVNKDATGSDTPKSGDYDWGTLVKTIEYKSGKTVDSNSSAKIQPGDVLQFRNVVTSNGGKRTHHTAVVAAVDSKGKVTKVYEQNISVSGVKGSDRTLSLRSLDLSNLKGGMVKVYHPESRISTKGQFEFVVVNNSSKSQKVKIGSTTVSLTAANTLGSYNTWFWYTTGNGSPTITFNGKDYSVQNWAGYQITGSGSSLKLSKIV